jgi:hypothetical protein
LLVFLEEAVDLVDLLVLELEGQPGLDFAVEFVLAEEHGGLVDAKADGETS